VLLQQVGYWGNGNCAFPDPVTYVDESWDESERGLVAEHLLRGFVARAYMGYSNCRLCGVQNGSLELTDGVFLWPDGLAHYVQAHAVRLPAAFVDHVITFTDKTESALVDDSWWRKSTRASRDRPGTCPDDSEPKRSRG
jgi:hypothetical protein